MNDPLILEPDARVTVTETPTTSVLDAVTDGRLSWGARAVADWLFYHGSNVATWAEILAASGPTTTWLTYAHLCELEVHGYLTITGGRRVAL